MLRVVLCVACCASLATAFSAAGLARAPTRLTGTMRADEGFSRKDALSRAALGGAAALLVTSTPLLPAVAIDRPAAKALFFRYSPRIESGNLWFASQLKKAVEVGDWAGVARYFDQTPDNPKKKERATFSSAADRDFYRPMSLLASSFAEKGVSKKTDALKDIAGDFQKAMDKLEGAARGYSGKKSGGFLGFFANEEPDVLKGRPQTVVAKEAYGEAKAALIQFVDVTNEGLDFDLKRVEAPVF